MRLNKQDIEWLNNTFPNLILDEFDQKITGEMDFCAAYNTETKKLSIEGLDCNYGSLRQAVMGLCDVFEIEIWLNQSLTSEAWPKVYEVGGRHQLISKKRDIPPIDLHFYPQDGSCCLGIKLAPTKLNIKDFIYHIVIPFFYRLAYVDYYGLQATKNDLWGEYSHGNDGIREHCIEMLELNRLNDGRNAPCPCDSGKKYKKCHLDEVQATIVALKRRNTG